MGRRRRRPDTPLFLRFVVAAWNSRDPTVAQFVCSGVDDEVEINLAFAALGASEGVVELLDGDFVPGASIAFTANNQTLRGQGRATHIQGNALPAGAHAIVLSGFTECTIENLAVETQAGGGDVTHCIFIEDGAHNFKVEHVTIVDSDDDGIHVEGTTINQGHIHLCHVEAADGEGIRVDMDIANLANRFHIEDNDIVGCGGDGIHLATTGVNQYCQVVNNIVYNCTGDGIAFHEGDFSMVRGNTCLGNGGDGIEINQSTHTQVLGNLCQGNTLAGIYLNFCTYITITGNICQGNTTNGIASITTGYLTIVGNTCQGNTLNGISLSESVRTTIVGNSCDGNSDSGIYLHTDSDHCTITGNNCSHNVEHGIYLSASDSCTISGNVCRGNDSGNTNAFDGIFINNSHQNVVIGNNCQDNDRHGIFIDGNSDDNKIVGNYLTGNANGDITVGAATCDHTEIVWNTIEDGAVGDAGTLTRHSGNFDPSANAYIVLQGAAPF